MTNFEKIKNMSVEELANSLVFGCDCCIYFDPCVDVCDCKGNCEEGIKKWLESEVKEREENE